MRKKKKKKMAKTLFIEIFVVISTILATSIAATHQLASQTQTKYEAAAPPGLATPRTEAPRTEVHAAPRIEMGEAPRTELEEATRETDETIEYNELVEWYTDDKFGRCHQPGNTAGSYILAMSRVSPIFCNLNET